MTGTDGRRAHDGSGAPVPPARGPRWPSVRGDDATGTARTPDPAPAWPQPAPTSAPAAAEPAAPLRRTRRDLRADADATATGAHPVVPSPATGDPRPAPVPRTAADPGPASEPGAASDPGPESGAPQPPAATPGRRRRWWIAGAVALAVLLVAGGTTAWLLLRDDGPTTPEAGPVVEQPLPTSTVAPVARPATTAFATALPTTLLQYALAASAEEPQWLGGGALEAYAESYTDGASGTVAVQAGQWETPEEAAAFLATLTAGLPAAGQAPADGATAAAGAPAVLLQEDVLVAGQPTGTATVVDAGDGTGVAVWSNGTTVFRLTGPAADIRNLYAAYPL